MGEAYEKSVKQLNDARIQYYHFDFHNECRNMQWHKIQILLDTIEEDLIQQRSAKKNFFRKNFFLKLRDSNIFIVNLF